MSKSDPACPVTLIRAQRDAPAALKAAWAAHRIALMAALTAKLGDLDMAEDALSEAALRAQNSWSVAIPRNASGWLYRVALNAGRDMQRRKSRQTHAEPMVKTHQSILENERFVATPDMRLALFQRCAAPGLSQDQQMALMLFHLAGLDCATIARAFLIKEAAVHQRLSRARAKLKILPVLETHHADLASVRSALEVIYLQSYRRADADIEQQAMGRDALQLARALCDAAPTDTENWGVLALFLLFEARRTARLSDDGMFIPFDHQDVGLWSGRAMGEAARAMHCVAAGSAPVAPYAVRAQIEMTRMMARHQGRNPDFELLSLQDHLLDLTSDPFVAIDRALVLARIEGANVGLAALDGIVTRVDLSAHAGWHIAKADLHRKLGEAATARLHLQSALTVTDGRAEQAFIRDTLDTLSA